MTAMTLFANGGAVANPLKGKINLSAALTNTGGRNRISLKGARFRLVVAGKEIAVRDEPYLDVMVVGVAEHVQRTFYKGKYDPATKAAPDCYSLDGQKPDAKAKEPQCGSCAACPQNVKGSKIGDNGKKSIACSFAQRLIVALPGDDEERLYELNVNSISLFGEGLDGERKYPLKAYVKFLNGFKTDLGEIVHRVSFDMDSSVPKLYFSPSRNLEPAEVQRVLGLVGSDEVKDMLAGDMDFSHETTTVVEQAAPAVAMFEAPAKPEPAVQAAPKAPGRPRKDTQPAPAPVVEPEVIEDDEDGELADLIAGFE